MEEILKNFPDFKPSWDKHLKWWSGESAGLSNDMSAFSDYTMDLLNAQSNKQEIEKIFKYIEFLMTNGDDAVKDAAATCFLENLINATSWKKIDATGFVHLLGPESKKFCKAWDEFTGVKTEGLWPNENE